MGVTVVRIGAALALGLLISYQANAQGILKIYHINVGQGDATLIISPSEKSLLIDGGNTGKGRRNVGPLLRKLNIKTLNYVIATHYDADHIGGLDEVVYLLQDVPADVYDRGDKGPAPSNDTKAYRDYVEAAGDSRKTIKLGRGRGIIDLGEGVSVLVAAANGCVYKKRNIPLRKARNENGNYGYLDANGASVAFILNFGKFDYFIGGDLTGGGRTGNRWTQDLESLVAEITGDVDVLRISHHGSQTSSNMTFLETLAPEVAVISVGDGGSNRNRYHHPRRSVLNRLHALKDSGTLKQVVMTNRGETDGGLDDRDMELIRIADGDIFIMTNGEYYTVNGATYAVDDRVSHAANDDFNTIEECKTDE